MIRIAVLMGGGKGTRFWPMSVKKRPKQFLKIFSERTMLQVSSERLIPLVGEKNIWVVTVRGMEEEVRRQLPFIEDRIIIEPVGRNTAPAVLLSMRRLMQVYDNFLVSFLPADHHIEKINEFIKQMSVAYEAAERDVVTIGIPPTRPETGYGYIKFDRRKEILVNGVKFYRALGFVEKPSMEIAIKMLEEGNYFWNSGIFLWKANLFVEKLQKFSPEFYNYFQEMGTGDPEEIYREIKALPIDKAFMEKLPGFLVAEAKFSWSDLGSWLSLWEVLKKDSSKNASKGEVYFHDSRGNLVITGKRTIVIGAEDLAIIETEHGLLVMKKDASSTLKKLLESIDKQE